MPVNRMVVDQIDPDGGDRTETGERVLGTLGLMGGIPNLPTLWVRCYLALTRYNLQHFLRHGEELQETWAVSSNHYLAQNQLVVGADGRCDIAGAWILMLDCDVLFPPTLVRDMLRSRELIVDQEGSCDILTGVYYDRGGGHLPVVYDDSPNKWTSLIEAPCDRPYPVKAAGTGCLLAQRYVIEAIVEELKELPFDPLTLNKQGMARAMGHDMSFFERANKLHFSAWADPRIPLGHLSERVVTQEDFQRLKQHGLLRIVEEPNAQVAE